MVKYIYTDENNNTKTIQTNLNSKNYDDLKSGIWELGFISDNQLLRNKECDTYYQTEKDKITDEDVRCFKNKITVKLCDGSVKTGHMIHWVESKDYFCISHSKFWDQFDN